MDEPTMEQQYIDYWGYLKSIDWTDPWLIGLISLHLITTSTTYLTRNYGGCQIVLFLLLLGLVYFSETINQLAARHWRTFSREQYFDSDGLFISTVFSIPILLNCMLLIGTWLYGSTQLMATVKTAQLKQMKRKQQQRLPQDNVDVKPQATETPPAVVSSSVHAKED